MIGAVSARSALLTGAVCFGAVACSPSASESAPGSPESKVRLPATVPSIVGRITAVYRDGERIGSIRVEAQPDQAAGSHKAVVRIGQDAVILLPESKSGDFNSLRTGQWVRAWFTGPVMESYPVQAKGSTVVIDSLVP